MLKLGMKTKSSGKGESGILVDWAAYHRDITVNDIASIVIPICTRYNVVVPSFEIRPHRHYRRGTCYYHKRLIALNLPIRVGVLYHELAHHISFQLYRNLGKGHGYWFKKILSDIFRDNNI